MAIEIILIVVGVIFLIGSCLVQEKLSEKDVDQIAKLGDEEIKIILEKKINILFIYRKISYSNICFYSSMGHTCNIHC